MKFFLNDRAVLDPILMKEQCQTHGFPMDWYGKANSFVDQLGVDPSYGYFLVDYQTVLEATQYTDFIPQGNSGDLPTIPSGSFKLTLRIVFNEFEEDTTINKYRIFKDLYLDGITSITPSWTGEQSFYLIKLVDARFVFSYPEASIKAAQEPGWGTACDIHYWNKVLTYLSPEELKETYDLTNAPNKGRFIYDESTTKHYLTGDSKFETLENGKPGIPKALTWKELIENIISIHGRSGYVSSPDYKWPFWETSHKFELKEQINSLGAPVYPTHQPQNITNKHRSIRDTLYTILFYCNLTLRYDGDGVFTLLPLKNRTVGNSTDLDIATEKLYTDGIGTRQFSHVTIGDKVSPISFELMSHILPNEESEYEKQEYHRTSVYIGDDAPKGVGYRQIKLFAPYAHFSEREETSSAGSTFPVGETYLEIKEGFVDRLKNYYELLDYDTDSFNGFWDLKLSSVMERVIWAFLGNAPFTEFDSVVPKDHDRMQPPMRIPVENLFSIIVATCTQDVFPETDTFTFNRAKVITGFRPEGGKGIALNYFKQTIVKNEKVILCYGKPLGFITEDNKDLTNRWTTFDEGLKYCRLRAPTTNLDVSGTLIQVPIDKVEVVNGRKPDTEDDPETEDDETTLELLVHNDPRVKPSNGYIYFAYDETAGVSVESNWSTADAANFDAILRGYPGYSSTVAKVLSNPGDAIQWIEAIGGGSGGDFTPDQIQQIINLINQNTGGTTGNVIMLRALVNKEGGVKSTDPVFDFKDAVVVLGNSTVTAGSCDNDFKQPFVYEEEVLLIRKANGMWIAIKIGFHLVVGTVLNGAGPDDIEFNVSISSTLLGSQVTNNVVAVNSIQASWPEGEKVYLIRANDTKWIPFKISKTPNIVLGKTASPITEDDITITLTSNLQVISGITPSLPLQVRNLFGFNIPADGWVEAKYSEDEFEGTGPAHWYASQAECEEAP